MLKAASVKPTDDDIPWDYETIVVLGSPTTSMGLIAKIEDNMPFRTVRDKHGVISFCGPGGRSYIDGNEEEHFDQDQVPLTKHLLLTRRYEQRPEGSSDLDPQSRLITLLSGHSRSVQAVAELLTSEDQIHQLMHKSSKALPEQFQALFEVGFETNYGELIIKKTKVLRVHPLKPKKEHLQ
jgi:hypothetical protein